MGFIWKSLETEGKSSNNKTSDDIIYKRKKNFKKMIDVKNIMQKYLCYQSYIKSKVGDLGRGWPEGSLFNSYNTEV